MAACPSCGHEYGVGARFCESCGARLDVEEPREVRKVVTLLFCDVSGSTALGEDLDSESLRRVMERYFAVAQEVVENHGGTVEKFIGDAVMAVFGIPVVHEDDALRAARAAVELRDRVHSVNDELKREFGIELAVRIGVNTGEVVAGRGGTLVTGDPVNVAARLQQAAAPGEILIGERTRQLAESAFELEAIDPVTAKGKAEPVIAHRLVAVHEDAAPFLRRFDAPFVGRTAELAQLQQAYARAVGDRSCHLFTLLGNAGVGKSRLTHEFLAALENATVLRGRCLAYGQGITYFPLIEIVETLASDPGLGAILEREPEARRYLNTVSAAIGAADAPSLSREETFQGVRKLFEALARERPIVVLIDDLHWAEQTLLDLVDHLADWSRDAPMLLLCLGRPELLDAHPGWGGGKLNATTTLLEPLPDEQAELLVDNLLLGERLAEDLRARITETAEGNPLFVEQMLALLAQNGGNGHGEVVVPPTIQSLLATRLEQLPAGERTTAERASVIGKEFWVSPLAELGADVSTLPSLVRKELVRPYRSATFPNDDAFRFRHLLVRDAAYDAMPKELRSELHERFADWLEQSRSGFDEIVGFHLEQAYRLREQLGPLDEGARAIAKRASERLGSAGHRALDRSDLPGAINLLTRAIDLLPPDSAARRRLLVDLGQPLLDAGELDAARSAFAQARESARIADDAAVEARARVGLAVLDNVAGVELAGPLLEEVMSAIGTLERAADDVGLAEAWQCAALFQSWLGSSAGAAQAYERAAFHARRAGNRRLERNAVATRTIQEAWGHLSADDGLRTCDDLLGREQGTFVEPLALSARALYAGWQGDFAAARRDVRRGRALLRDFGNELLGHATSMVEAIIELEAGDALAAEAIARDGYLGLKELDERAFRSTVAAVLAEALYLQGRYEEAERFALEASELSGADDYVSQNRSLALRAKILARRGEAAEAERLARQAVEIVARTDGYGEHGEALVHEADVFELVGRTDEARAALEQAVVLFERKGATAPADKVRARLAGI